MQRSLQRQGCRVQPSLMEPAIVCVARYTQPDYRRRAIETRKSVLITIPYSHYVDAARSVPFPAPASFANGLMRATRCWADGRCWQEMCRLRRSSVALVLLIPLLICPTLSLRACVRAWRPSLSMRARFGASATPARCWGRNGRQPARARLRSPDADPSDSAPCPVFPGEHILPVLSVRVSREGTYFSQTSSTDPKEQVRVRVRLVLCMHALCVACWFVRRQNMILALICRANTPRQYLF